MKWTQAPTITFAIESGAVTKVSGTHLPDMAVEASGEEPLSAAAALSSVQTPSC